MSKLSELDLYTDPDYRDTFAALWNIAEKHSGCEPLVPWAGDIYLSDNLRDGAPKMMWCGIATDGWGEPATNSDRSIESSVRGTREFLLNTVDQYSSTSGFWRIMVAASAMVAGLFGASMPAQMALGGGVVWNNAYKVGGLTGNPAGALEREQRTLSAIALLTELRFLKPTITVFHTGQSAIELIRQVAPWDEWTHRNDHCWTRTTDIGLQIWLTRDRAVSVAAAVDQVRWSLVDWLRDHGRKHLAS